MSEKALKNVRKLSYPDRDTHVLRSGYACTSVGVRMYLGRGTVTMKHFWDDFRVKRKRQNMWKGKTIHVKRKRPTACVVFKDNIFKAFSLRGFLKTIETIETIFYVTELSHLWYGISSKRPRRGRISITAGEDSEANVTCGFTARKQDVLEEGEHKQAIINTPLMFALFEDDCLR